MAVLNLEVTLPDVPSADVDERYKQASRFTETAVLKTMLQALGGGNLRGTLVVTNESAATAASGTVTLAAAQAADTVTVNGVVFTAVSGTPAANQFDISGTNAQAATSLASAIANSATALIAATVTATAASAVVTISAKQPGVAGNAYTLVSSNGTRLAVSGARLASGANDATEKTYSF